MVKTVIKSLVIAGCLVAVSYSSYAQNYVPPPSGPYQSSVVINSNRDDDSGQQQVYKFPPADITMEDDLPTARVTERGEISSSTRAGTIPSRFESESDALMNPTELPPYPQQPEGARGYGDPQWSQSPYQGMPSNNPAQWYGYPGQDQYYPNTWNQSPQGYGYQYPHSYGGRYDDSNNPFNSMPSPWSVMPKNPFFSDR